MSPDPTEPVAERPATDEGHGESRGAEKSSIRPARPQDVPEVLALVRELAAYEHEPDAVSTTEEGLREALFGDQPLVHCLVAETRATAGGALEIAGIAVWFVSFSTWTGKHGIWLEDLYVQPRFRGGGLGRDLLVALASECVERGWTRLEWNVLDWNVPALEFYRRLGAVRLDEWTVHRVADVALARLATGRKV